MSRLRISGQAIEEYEPVSSKVHRRMTFVLEKIRKHASLMYSALHRSWSTECLGGHSVNLYLQAPAVHLERKPTLQFEVCFCAMESGSETELLLLEKVIVVQRLEITPQLPVRYTQCARGPVSYFPIAQRIKSELCRHQTASDASRSTIALGSQKLMQSADTSAIARQVVSAVFFGDSQTSLCSRRLLL
jgi:hypothetical protein